MLGARIRAARERAGLSQPELAERAGVAKSFISMLETGKRARVGSDILARIAVALDTTLDALMQDTLAPPDDAGAPPVDLLRAAGYSEPLIARLVESWPRQPLKFRLDVVAKARRRVQENADLIGAFL